MVRYEEINIVNYIYQRALNTQCGRLLFQIVGMLYFYQGLFYKGLDLTYISNGIPIKLNELVSNKTR